MDSFFVALVSNPAHQRGRVKILANCQRFPLEWREWAY
jgi:hypothetical protein